MAKANQMTEAFDLQNIHHTYQIGKTKEHPHKVAASFSNLPDNEDRPHVETKIAGTKFWTLLDTGASISLITKKAMVHLIQFINLKLQEQRLYVQDCHSNIKETNGAVTITFDVLSPHSGQQELKNITAIFHIADSLSSDVLFGCDILRILGCKIDMNMEQTKVSFNHREANIFLNNKHPLFVSASAATTKSAIDSVLSDCVSKYSFAASPTNDIVINPGDQKTFKVEIDTDIHLQLQPGALVLVQSDGLNLQEPSTVMETTFANVQNDNKISITMANKSTKVAEIQKNLPILGLLIQSLATYHTPVEIKKEDIEIMPNITKTVEAAEAADPDFKEKIVNIATAKAILTSKRTYIRAICNR